MIRPSLPAWCASRGRAAPPRCAPALNGHGARDRRTLRRGRRLRDRAARARRERGRGGGVRARGRRASRARDVRGPGARASRARVTAPDALAAYEDALAHAPAPAERRRLLEAEVALLDSGALERELAIRRALAALEPRSEDAADRVVDVLERLGRPAEAADLPRGASHARGGAPGSSVASAPRSCATPRAMARARPRSSRPCSRPCRAPTSSAVRLVWMRALVVARHRDALPALAEALARAPGPVEWDVLGQVRDELGDLEGALEAERRAAGAHPGPALGRRIVGAPRSPGPRR